MAASNCHLIWLVVYGRPSCGSDEQRTFDLRRPSLCPIQAVQGSCRHHLAPGARRQRRTDDLPDEATFQHLTDPSPDISLTLRPHEIENVAANLYGTYATEEVVKIVLPVSMGKTVDDDVILNDGSALRHKLSSRTWV